MPDPAPPAGEIHKRLTQPNALVELDPVVQQLGDDCGQLYANLEVSRVYYVPYNLHARPNFTSLEDRLLKYLRSVWQRTTVTGGAANKVL